ncbi:hypothetical protein [Rhodoferax sediminis]|jgi:hypothetical protein|uniref:DUF3106 domain-containing protein n=1 Tax=Rhodoferax sediminis TaxID=2509614 RepID=A0A515DAI8_9BURK|nr:hypothetical protein [Rhodoferax sediminis]QDL37422.1 hypothetical protein EUB48_09165 [Rhodoferax sediminis]
MKKIVFLWAQILCLAGAFAQPPRVPAGVAHPPVERGPAGSAAQQGGVLPIQDSPAQRRIELRAILQSQQNALEQPATERRLSPEERAELREQVRQQYQGRPHNTGKP